ncbi:type III restriction enzyme [Nitzschia inconspicua]|uniref:Type III restriction enzyme n=1 Tax=Nitzschia inconspicua TaxID=303405 RepID=A0A9K3PM22_9STRA|nr:type III restriction enzyme [Nitzschia inconspicua]
MFSNGNPRDSRRDLQNLLSILSCAGEIADSSISYNVMAENMGHSNLNAFAFLEPTPIRPDHEIMIRKHMFSTKNNKQVIESNETANPFSSLTSSNAFLGRDDEALNLHKVNEGPMIAGNLCTGNIDDEPLNLHQADLAPENSWAMSSDDMDDLTPVVSGNMSKECSVTPANESFSRLAFVGGDISLGNTSDASSASIRFLKHQTSQWDKRFQELLLFVHEHGHALVPHSYFPNQKLAQWAKRQRHQYKRKKMGHHSTLTDERENKLLEVGFVFDSHRAAWQVQFECLKAFSLANGHCRIPRDFEDRSLEIWMKHQRRQYVLLMKGRKSTMTDDRIAALNSIGFNWNPRNLVRPSKV